MLYPLSYEGVSLASDQRSDRIPVCCGGVGPPLGAGLIIRAWASWFSTAWWRGSFGCRWGWGGPGD